MAGVVAPADAPAETLANSLSKEGTRGEGRVRGLFDGAGLVSSRRGLLGMVGV